MIHCIAGIVARRAKGAQRCKAQFGCSACMRRAHIARYPDEYCISKCLDYMSASPLPESLKTPELRSSMYAMNVASLISMVKPVLGLLALSHLTILLSLGQHCFHVFAANPCSFCTQALQ